MGRLEDWDLNDVYGLLDQMAGWLLDIRDDVRGIMLPNAATTTTPFIAVQYADNESWTIINTDYIKSVTFQKTDGGWVAHVTMGGTIYVIGSESATELLERLLGSERAVDVIAEVIKAMGATSPS